MTSPVPPPGRTGTADPTIRERRWSGPAPAKVNLFLRVLAREEGGYHQVETLFQALELADQVTLEVLPGPGAIQLEVEGVPADALGPPEQNLAVRAAGLLLDAAGGEPPGLRIHLVKRIPHGAGLGGGSSDAATVLRGLNELLGRPLDAARLVTLGGRLGADVAFFLCGSPLALAWGRGDRLLPLPPLPAADVIVALPEARIATPDAYARLARWRAERGKGAAPARVMGAVSSGRVATGAPWSSWAAVAREAENDFAPALHGAYPELARIRDELEAAGARPALLSGSGSAVFGLFPEGGSDSLTGVEAEGAESGNVRIFRTRTRGDGGGGGTALRADPGP
ncbi:MAG: 4-(cytidine 5'-diphospho)-2-C-methyl-D-erythritol kinase [Gemmatimonadales bacterium]|nr:MAG: 4-(cytidine 5'-diphospho)-2-C-methyl-D-erythritol kinase [Gemmatimonadales bacterium]